MARSIDFSNEPAFAVGAWSADPATLTLFQQGDSIRLEPRVMALLVTLSRSRGEVLSRQDLLDRAWPDVVVGDEALTVAISKLRRALDRESRLVETIPRVGYRLLDEQPATVQVEETASGDETRPSGERRSRRLAVAIFVLLLVVAVLAGAAWLIFTRLSFARLSLAPSDPPSASSLPLQITGLTATPGLESQASLDPTGRRVVFLRIDPQHSELVLLDLETGEESTLYDGGSWAPAWSPIDQRIAFMRRENDQSPAFLSLIASTGGRVEDLREIDPSPLVGLDWSPDARRIAWSDYDAERGTHAIRELDLETKRVRQLTAPAPSTLGDGRPVYSPDGRWLAFTRGPHFYSYDLWLLELATSEERRLTDDRRQIWGAYWGVDSRSVVISSNRAGVFQLWSVPVDGEGAATWIPLPDEQVRHPVARGSTIVYDVFEVLCDVYEVRAENGEAHLSGISSKARESAPSFSPDGRRLAFASTRSGDAEIWMREPDGTSRRLTRLGASILFFINWSPDGSRLAASLVVEGEFLICLVDARSGDTRRLPTPDGAASTDPVFAPDGRSVFVTSAAGGSYEMWEIALAEGAEPKRVTDFGAMAIRFAADGTAFLLPTSRPELWKRAADGGWEPVLEDFMPARAFSWVVLGDDVHALHQAEDGDLVWKRWSLVSGEAVELAKLPPRLENGGFAVHPEGRTALVGRLLPWESDLRMAVLPATGG